MSLTVLATDSEAREIAERFSRVVCPDPEHDGPCVNPWSLTSLPVDNLDPAEPEAWEFAVQELHEQRIAEFRDDA